MRLDFNILCVDDNQKYVQSTFETIKQAIRKEGFRLQVKTAMSVEEAKQFLSNDIYGDHIDLVLMDYHLPGENGDVGLKKVRAMFPYKDIIFYSAKPDELLPVVQASGLQGIFCSTRDDLSETALGIFEVLVKKVLDIDHSRGIVMGTTSDIDQYVKDCLASIFDASEKDAQDRTLAVITRHMKDKQKSFTNDSAKILAAKHVTDLYELHGVYTSNDRLRLLKNALEINKIHAQAVKHIENFLATTVVKRNLLAHVRVNVDGFSRKLFDKNGKEFTSEDMKNLRAELLTCQEVFEALHHSLVVAKAPAE